MIVISTLFYAHDTAQNMGIGTRLCDTACTYTRSVDIAPALYHYRLCSPPSPCWGLALGKLS